MSRYFEDLDLENFWEDCDYALEEYTEPAPCEEMTASIEQELGYKLPASYIALMQVRNGGLPHKTHFPTSEATSWAEDHIAITGIMGIGREKSNALCGSLGSRFMIENWEYPAIGVCIADCPSAGHDMVMLDYRQCGPQGEPAVVHVDQERDYKITFLAADFETFIRGLVGAEVYDDSVATLAEARSVVQSGAFSTLLQELCAKHPGPENMEKLIRGIAAKLVEEKGYFGLQLDPLSRFLFDLQFILYTKVYPVQTAAEYLAAYPRIIASGDGAFNTGGFGPDFVEAWLKESMTAQTISVEATGLQYTSAAREKLMLAIQETLP